jgi:hypothetical protein
MGLVRAFLTTILLGGAAAGCASAEYNPPHKGQEVVSGGGQLRGGGLRMDVQIGHAFAQAPVSNGASSQSLFGGTVVRP